MISEGLWPGRRPLWRARSGDAVWPRAGNPPRNDMGRSFGRNFVWKLRDLDLEAIDEWLWSGISPKNAGRWMGTVFFSSFLVDIDHIQQWEHSWGDDGMEWRSHWRWKTIAWWISIRSNKLMKTDETIRFYTGWWFGTWLIFFHSVGNRSPNWLSLHHFFRGVLVYHQPDN